MKCIMRPWNGNDHIMKMQGDDADGYLSKIKKKSCIGLISGTERRSWMNWCVCPSCSNGFSDVFVCDVGCDCGRSLLLSGEVGRAPGRTDGGYDL